MPKNSCTPSCSVGSIEVRSGVLYENQTSLANSQWKKRWASSSKLLQMSQFLLILVERFLARAPVAIALLITLQVKALMLGGRNLCFQALLGINFAWSVMLLGPCILLWTCTWEFRILKASLAEHTPFVVGFQVVTSDLVEWTICVLQYKSY